MEDLLIKFQRETILATKLESILCDILAKNLAAFYPCSKNLTKANVKNTGLISLAKEFPRQPNIDSVTWLLVIPPISVYSEKEKVTKRNTKCTV